MNKGFQRQWPYWWYEGRGGAWPAIMLSPFAFVYRYLSRRRLQSSAPRVRVPVIAVGNFTVGGGGKTPLVQWLRRWAQDQGFAPAVLLRGYGNREGGGVFTVQIDYHSSEKVGDEALIHGRDGLTVIGRDRLKAAHVAMAEGADLLLMDDGVQSRRLQADITLMTVDALRGFGNSQILPSGPLRASLEAYGAMVDGLVIVGQGQRQKALALPKVLDSYPRFFAEFDIFNDDIDALKGKPVLAFAGLANPDKFFGLLASKGINLVETVPFEDHHVWTEKDAQNLLHKADLGELELVTTLKDAVKFDQDSLYIAELAKRVHVLDGALQFCDQAEDFAALLQSKMRGFKFVLSSI